MTLKLAFSIESRHFSNGAIAIVNNELAHQSSNACPLAEKQDYKKGPFLYSTSSKQAYTFMDKKIPQ